MNIILLGAPGSGKGTQGALLASRVGIPKVATGDLLRTAVRRESVLGTQARSFMDAGLLVPDEIIMGLISEVLASPEARGGVIMDGFPRTVAQAVAVDSLLSARDSKIDKVLTFEVPENELVDRLVKRSAQEGRTDDTPAAIRRRLEVYREQTEPLVAFYRERGVLEELDGVGSVEAIAERTAKALGYDNH
ncbi:MAG: adenylate kinase [Gemmatimonadales bacterium]